MDKLFVIVRADLSPGAQVAQTAHAVAEFSIAHPDAFRSWAAEQRTIVCLNIQNEATLADLLKLAEAKGVARAGFTEPDFGGELTAIALGPGGDRLVSCLPLALRQQKRAA